MAPWLKLAGAHRYNGSDHYRAQEKDRKQEEGTTNPSRGSIATNSEQRLWAAGYGSNEATAAWGRSEQREKEELKGFGIVAKSMRSS